MNTANFTIILDYEFERVIRLNCSPGEEAFDKIENVKDECKINEKCIGVFQKNCTEDENYHLCLRNETSSSQSQPEGCFYKKFSISM